ncbi:MAG: ParB/RepB/Spo0J family partition protein [Thermoanaerobaculaceae bacterium]|nr:ParB/RepB/Spo0J family partition protein [Thermoanaerobaculaceae bacterium]
MSSRRGLPDFRKMRHDRHFVDEITNHSVTGVGMMLSVEEIEANREQPRSALGDIGELAESIRARGVLEPLLVRRHPSGRGYQLVAGERRFRAALAAGLREVPCIEVTATDQQALELALVENLQRKDLTPFEEAEGYRALVEKYGYTHEQVAHAVGRSRTSVTETLQLLHIPPALRDLCRHADITAKSVLLLVARAGSIPEMERLIQEIVEGNLDREGARAALRAPSAATPIDEAAEAGGGQDPTASRSGFRPLSLRFKPAPDAPIHLSLSIRRPNVSRDEVIQTLEELLRRLRAGELDERLNQLASKPSS